MDDTTFREILNALTEESETDPSRIDLFNATRDITQNMYRRAAGFAAQQYPYGRCATLARLDFIVLCLLMLMMAMMLKMMVTITKAVVV